MLYGGAAIQLTSGTSGITIESEPVTGDLSLLRYNTVVQKITIGPEMYRILKVLYTEEEFSYRKLPQTNRASAFVSQRFWPGPDAWSTLKKFPLVQFDHRANFGCCVPYCGRI